MKNIVIGINFSEQSTTVLKFGLKLAQFHTSELTVVYVLNDKKLANIVVSKKENRADVLEVFRLEKEAQLTSFIKEHRAKQFHSIPINIDVRFGNVHEELRKAAKEIMADLLMVGKFTKTGNLFFSDTSNKLISYASCPVFIVPEDVHFDGFDRIIYAADFILEDCESLFFLIPWLIVFQAELICIHICKNKEEEPRAKHLASILKKLFPQNSISFRTVIYDVEKGIDRYVELSKSDMIATLHRERNLWGGFFKKSISKTIANDVTVPMIIFKEQ